MSITVTVYDDEDRVLMRLATLPAPSAHAVVFGNRHDIVREDAEAMQFYSRTDQYLRELRIRLAWITRRLRRDLGNVGQTYISAGTEP